MTLLFRKSFKKIWKSTFYFEIQSLDMFLFLEITMINNDALIILYLVNGFHISTSIIKEVMFVFFILTK